MRSLYLARPPRSYSRALKPKSSNGRGYDPPKRSNMGGCRDLELHAWRARFVEPMRMQI